MEQQAADKLHHGGQNGFAVQGIAVLQESRIEARGLHLAFFTDETAHAGSVVAVEERGNLPHIRAAFAAPQEHRRQQRIGRRFLPPQGTQQGDAETTGFEFFTLHTGEEYTGQKFCSSVQSIHPFQGMVAYWVIIPQFVKKVKYVGNCLSERRFSCKLIDYGNTVFVVANGPQGDGVASQ